MNQSIIEDLVTASHILANEGVLDRLGLISMRHPDNPERYLISRSLTPALVQPSDTMEYDLDSNAVARQGRALFLERFPRRNLQSTVRRHVSDSQPFPGCHPIQHQPDPIAAGV
jgi:hypothetical protein